MNLEPRWWGLLGGLLHSYESLVDNDGSTLIRTASNAACGLRAPYQMMESPLDPPAKDRLCGACRRAIETQPCECCDGDGQLDTCPSGHGAGCDCNVIRIDCPDCDGTGEEPRL